MEDDFKEDSSIIIVEHILIKDKETDEIIVNERARQTQENSRDKYALNKFKRDVSNDED